MNFSATTYLVLKIKEGGNPSLFKALRQIQFSVTSPGVNRTTETLLLVSHSFSVNCRGQSPSEAFLKRALLLGLYSILLSVSAYIMYMCWPQGLTDRRQPGTKKVPNPFLVFLSKRWMFSCWWPTYRTSKHKFKKMLKFFSYFDKIKICTCLVLTRWQEATKNMKWAVDGCPVTKKQP